MAALFYVGGTYDGVTNTLATSSGGPATVAAIAAGDSVTFDANSGAGTIATTAPISCTTMNMAAGFTGGLSLGAPLTTSGAFTLTQGGLTSNGNTVSWGTFARSGTNVCTLNLAGSPINYTGTGTIFSITNWTNFTYDFTGCTHNINDAGASAKSFITTGAAVSLGAMKVAPGGAGIVTFNIGALTKTFTTLTLNAPKTIRVTGAGTIAHSALVAVGSPGSVIDIRNTTGGTQFSFSQASGYVACDYLTLQDCKGVGGAAFFAGANSTNVSGNSGWTFARAPNSDFFVAL